MNLADHPAAGFDQPLDILDACHARIRRNCHLVVRIAEHLQSTGLDDEARQAAASAMRFFDLAGANHHADEEEDLFPALLRAVPSLELNATRALIYKLQGEHARLDLLYTDMKLRLAAIAQGHDLGLTPEIAGRFGRAYEDHIAREERDLLPLARRVLTDRLISWMGRSMAERRNAGHGQQAVGNGPGASAS